MRETSLIKKKKTWQIIAENLLSAYGISQLGVTAARHLRLWTQKRKGSFVSSSGFNSPIAFGFWQGQRMAVAGTCVPVKSSHHQLGRETEGGDGSHMVPTSALVATGPLTGPSTWWATAPPGQPLWAEGTLSACRPYQWWVLVRKHSSRSYL